MKLGIFGVGRSGTTALYVGIQHMVISGKIPCRFLYEPYLWSHRVFDAPFNTIKTQFQSTASLSIEGMYAHSATPLFTEESSEAHDDFISNITQDSNDFLLKTIRANGRLGLFLKTFPDLKAVLIIRNPLDVINSVIDRFSFFGDEFHPSDKPRFSAAISQESLNALGKSDGKEKDEVEWSLLWWQHMNRAALQTAHQHRDRVIVVAYEAFSRNPVRVLQHIGHFFDLDTDTLSSHDSKRPVGEVSKQVYLRPSHVSFVRENDDVYWRDWIWESTIPLDIHSYSGVRDALYSEYESNAASNANPQSLQIPTDWSTLLLRRQLLHFKQENRALLMSKGGGNITSAWHAEHLLGDDWEHTRFS